MLRGSHSACKVDVRSVKLDPAVMSLAGPYLGYGNLTFYDYGVSYNVVRVDVENRRDILNASQDDNDAQQIFYGLNMQHLVLLCLCIFLVLIALLIASVVRIRRVYLRRKRRRRKLFSIQSGFGYATPRSSNTSSAQAAGVKPSKRNGFLARMIARIDEFDALTPLVITPGSTVSLLGDEQLEAHANTRHKFKFRRRRDAAEDIDSMNVQTGSDMEAGLQPECSSLVESQPLIRITSPTPLNGGQVLVHARVAPPVPSAAQLMRTPYEELELLSIDRTSICSAQDRRSANNNHHSNDRSSSDLQYRCSLSDFLPSDDSCVSACQAPLRHQRPNSGGKGGNRNVRFEPSMTGGDTTRSPSTDSILSSSLGSPADSSVGADSGSPVDTTGSGADLSDSVYNASESDASESSQPALVSSRRSSSMEQGKQVTSPSSGISERSSAELELSPYECSYEPSSASLRKYHLHRIDEVSEEYETQPNASSSSNSSVKGCIHSKTVYPRRRSGTAAPDKCNGIKTEGLI